MGEEARLGVGVERESRLEEKVDGLGYNREVGDGRRLAREELRT